jgi:hypothetical protein
LNQLIWVLEPQAEVLCQDLINEIRAAEDSFEGIAHGKIADASGKEQLAEGILVGITIELLENWQLKFWAGDYIAKIHGGNLVGGPANDPVAYTPGVQALLILSASATLVTMEGGGGDGGLTQEEHDWLMSLPTLAQIEASSTLNMQDEILRILGLVQENYYLDQTSYDANGQLLAGRIRIYSVAGSVGTANDVIATYTITPVWVGTELQTYKVEKV